MCAASDSSASESARMPATSSTTMKVAMTPSATASQRRSAWAAGRGWGGPGPWPCACSCATPSAYSRVGEPQPAAGDPRAGGAQPGNLLARDEPGLVGERVDDLKPAGDALRRVDDHRDDGDAAAQLAEAVAMGRGVAVVAPDPAQRGGPRRPRRAQRAHDLGVEGALRVA